MRTSPAEATTGVILRTRPLTETSLIVQWLTEGAGRISTVAKGARGPRSPFRGKLDLFHVADLTFRRSRRSDLHTLAEVGLKETHPALRTDWRRLTRAAYGVALIEQSTEADTPIPETYRLFLGFLGHVHGGEAAPWSVLALELKHLAEMGMVPDLERASLPDESRGLGTALLGTDWDGIGRLDAAPAAVVPLARFLQGFLIFHL
ncbi:MAG: DNA repair protein RecO, partial [Limisphaerales bacterium]